jgi:hypothetical protein
MINAKVINRISLLGLVAVLGTYPVANGQGFTKTGMTGATFLTIEVGPRAKAMGGAFVCRHRFTFRVACRREF